MYDWIFSSHSLTFFFLKLSLFVTDASDFPSDEEHEKGVIKTNLIYRVDCTTDPPELKLRDDLSGRVLSENFMDNSQVQRRAVFGTFV